ncbi:NAD(P)/FAD-dependent oxidoreductase [Heyndrickxia ginsengihumi]|uniref:NAD(P)/FAD-dependent oxidoreductase n=1 Tax=Heyndrickxia ginsengihumi TaxID=363870 RepID=A0A6M0P7Q2_9BACI|nr:NAD(P)/FAD-dependent oxidoreductase [Heyndrickxia ginsengihumi]MBE6183183.1 NAD(P)/FAD-dependent oxidoreductase [Bacillus sp. (in: firmicutes)]MCM3023855.1 NAD(P)/FAD-dependent oxidoreductase [Heyndrickxia ginsengihumi]NEY20724.1 NAD(P)/FAD-dependent oxidoreductase [Heyndrickxia ginsengihumi]
MSKKIVILGAGYGGVLTALTAREYLNASDASITVVNRVPDHQIITELHRLAAGNVTEKRVALPLKKLFKGKDIDIKVDEVTKISPDAKEVELKSGDKLSYDVLVVGLGSETAFFGIPGLQENSFLLKSVDDAKRIYAHVRSELKEYAKTKNKANATFVIGGGGLTGVELIGELADQMPTWTKELGIDASDVRLICVEAAPSILPVFAPNLIERATESLEARGVEFLTGIPVTKYEDGVVELKDGQKIETNTLVWTGGVQGNTVVANSGLAVDRGRATVNEYLQSTSHSDVFVVGDSAVVFPPEGGRPYPPTAQNSWQMGELVGYNLFAYFNNSKMNSFNPVNSGTLASLGRKDAIATIGANQTQLKGFPASAMKEASNIRYLSHIKGLFSIVY